ncbi:CopG family transcriptional regulator [Ignisphaera sp. 4213-co]|uniref:CopG family transcriptional regulator n=1 Tax=Ignisphaera cupida TaxID=3050454 RepID=A0ABD4Z453_9CREN|nr:CopG family transcriptional regulator [Ignisphaera sp. 4213-co]MDK6027909.1 CopG family transcriptional regulator [Ignisphaera sp. 4213-co]
MKQRYRFLKYLTDVEFVVKFASQVKNVMSVVISVRIPKKLKEQMDMLKRYVNWGEEIRRFLEKRVEEVRRMVVLEEVRNVIEQLPEVPRGTVTKYVREDRNNFY